MTLSNKYDLENYENFIAKASKEFENLNKKEISRKSQNITVLSFQPNTAKPYPFETNMKEILTDLKKGGMLKKIEPRSIDINYKNFLTSNQTETLTINMFWIVYIVKFNGSEDIVPFYKKKVSRAYLELMNELPKTKNSLIHYILFCVAYCIHKYFFLHFPDDKKHFDSRFIFDCYHITLYEIHGIYVSDYYIQNNIEKIFTSQFLNFENTTETLQSEKQAKIYTKESWKSKAYKNRNSSIGTLKFMAALEEKLHIPEFKSKALPTKSQIPQFENENKNTDETDFITQQPPIQNKNLEKGKLKFNCFQISPALFDALNQQSMKLKFKNDKIVNHNLDRINNFNTDFRNLASSYLEDKETEKEKLKFQNKVPTARKNQPNFCEQHGVRVVYDRSIKYPKFFKNMEEHLSVFNEIPQRMSQLPQIKKILENANKSKMMYSINRNSDSNTIFQRNMSVDMLKPNFNSFRENSSMKNSSNNIGSISNIIGRDNYQCLHSQDELISDLKSRVNDINLIKKSEIILIDEEKESKSFLPNIDTEFEGYNSKKLDYQERYKKYMPIDNQKEIDKLLETINAQKKASKDNIQHYFKKKYKEAQKVHENILQSSKDTNFPPNLNHTN